MTESQRLFAEYRASGSEAAFRELVVRYTDLVYSAALRLVGGDTHRAEDVVQMVFVDLARKARHLSLEGALAGWLYRDTCFVAAKAMRSERRRQARERQAVEMKALEDEAEASFKQIAPVLDEAMSHLAPEDQSAIVLRFFERLDFSSVGEALGSTEGAARKRVNRALEKLHHLLSARGVTLSAAALGTALAARAVEAAPAEVVASAAQAALASAATGHGTALTVLKGMTTSKIGVSVATAVGLAAASWLAWSLWGPWWPPKPPSLASNRTWTVLSKAQPLGYVVHPTAMALDGEGGLYVADGAEWGRIQKRDKSGNWSLVKPWLPPEGRRRLFTAMDVDASGSLYVAEPMGRIWKRDTQGNWTTLATAGPGADQVNGPKALAGDREGNLYVADSLGAYKGRILLRAPDGHWSVLAENGSDLGEVLWSFGLAADGEGNLYVADREAQRIQRRDRNGTWTIIDEDAMTLGLEGSPLALPVRPEKVATDRNGALYVSATGGPPDWSSQLLKREAKDRWTRLAVGGSGLGQITQVQAMSVDPAGALYITEWGNHRIQKRDPNGTWTVVCEALKEPGALLQPSSLAVGSGGVLYVLDESRRQVHKRDAQGGWSVVVDVPSELVEVHDPVETPALRLIKQPSAIAADREGSLYIADIGYHRVTKLNARGQWELCVPSGDGLGQTRNPYYISVDASDNLCVADGPPVVRIQKRDRAGHWTLSNDDIDPMRARFGVCTGPNGNVYVADVDSVRMRDAQGRWTIVAAKGKETGQVGRVAGLNTDSVGRLYVVDKGNQRLQVRDLDGKWFVLTAVGSEAGPLFAENFMSIAVDRQGIIYLTDSHLVFRWAPQPGGKTTRKGVGRLGRMQREQNPPSP
jgi:RNA polymerase sigma factor (sigma-70 family)